MGIALFDIIVFPGFIFLGILSLVAEFTDRKLNARLQNRVGPPWYQPLADFIKLSTKETIVPESASSRMFRALPLFALASASTAFLYIPIWSTTSLFPFSCDLIVVLYLLTVPTLTFFLAGWFSSSLYSEIGSIRTMTQLFAYEVPLYMALLGPAILADNWSISGIASYYYIHPLMALFNIPGLLVSLVAAQGKLERAPFDIPDAETEIVGGTFTEYNGRFLAFFRMSIDVELVVVATLIAAVFFPLFTPANAIVGFLIYLVKILFVIFLLAVLRTALARLRIEQMVSFCWRILAPLALLQVLIDLIVKGVLAH
ncbi:MAG: NADH-quinone oxidoreductase subunit H [Clostridia bacterium]|nr:NADH-quinone oxidoreductase subunit H [Clostridia bacterium]